MPFRENVPDGRRDMRTLEDIISILEADVNEIPRDNDFDEGFAAGIKQAIILIKHLKREAEK